MLWVTLHFRHGAYHRIGLAKPVWSAAELEKHPASNQKKSPGTPGLFRNTICFSYCVTTMIWLAVTAPSLMVRPPGNSAGLKPLAVGGVARST